MEDHNTPDDKVFAIARRKAIQEVMRDPYLAPEERNARLQQILTSIASSTEGNATSMPPPGLSNSSVQSEESIAERKRKAIRAVMQNKSLTSSQRNDEIQKIMKHSLGMKSDDITQNHEVYFSTIHSENRGDGLEERIRKKSNAMSNEGDGGGVKSEMAFIPSSFVSSQRKLIEEGSQSSAKQSSSRRLDDFENRIRFKYNAHEVNEIKRSLEKTSSAIFLEDFEQRIKEKSASASGERGTMRSTSSSMASVDYGMETFEARIREKITQPGATNSANEDTKLHEKLHTDEGGHILVERLASYQRLDEFEERVRKKTATYNAASHEERIGQEKSSPVKAMDEFEQRITAKAASSIKGEIRPTSSSTSSVDSKMDDFQARIREKTARANSSKSAHEHANMQAKLKKSSSFQSLEDFEKRLMNKASENQTGLNRLSSSWRLKSFDQRVVAKSTDSDAVNSRRPMSTSMSSSHSDSATFESRLLKKAHSANHDFQQLFESRALDKNQSARRKSSPEAQSELTGTLISGNSDLPPDVTITIIPVQTISTGDNDRDKSELSQAKRRVIRELMQDGSLTPQERNLRMQQIIAGDVLSFPATSNDRNEPDATQAKRSAIRKLMQDKSLTSQERNLCMQQIMRGNLAPLDLEVNANVENYGTSLIKEALDAKIAAKLKEKLRSEQSCNEELDRHPDDAEIANTMIECANRHVFVGLTNTSALEQSWIPSEDVHLGMSYSSLLRPEEQVSETFPSLRQSYGSAADVEAQGTGGQELAVATAVEGEDEPDYVYAAIEYDPNSKPPLHKHRRFRIYTFVALLVITVSMIVMAMYITKVSKADKVVNISYNLTNRPTSSPTPSPTSLREASGILEQLEAGVLRRDETFDAMEAGDPRLLALDWILHRDSMQLVSDDVNLYQRFVLAVFAYSLDSFAWYSCGKLGENFTFNFEEDGEKFPENVCPVWNPYINRTETFGVWLSSTPECTWFGITCSDDGVVKGIELIYNDLIGQIPHELFALDFLTYLALPGNCLYGTIPPEIGNLRHLLSLEIHSNGLSSSIPSEIYELDQLQLLNLAEQYGVERECTKSNGAIVNIYYRMGGTTGFEVNLGLTGKLDSRIKEWRSLKGLHLFENSLTGSIAPEIASMKYLTFLQIGDNFIEGSLPNEITSLRGLRYLRIEDNFVYSTLPENLGDMDDLEILMVNGNSMYGPVPESLFSLKKLEVIRLDETLSADPPWIEVSDEGFTGSISTEIGQLKNLRWLLLHSNPLSGTVPTELGMCERLEMVRLHRTNIYGTMPREVCMLRDKNLHDESGSRGILYADCSNNNRTNEPFLKCDCCTDCCDHTSQVCVADD